MSNYRKKDLKELTKFAKDAFELESILETAQTLKWHNSVMNEIEKEFENPSDEMVKLLAKRVYDGTLRQNILDTFRGIIERAYSELVNSQVDATLQSAILRHESKNTETEEQEIISGGDDNDIVTTEDEIQGHLIVTAIASKVVDPDRVVMRDAKSYCAILLDDNNRRAICRLHLNTSKWYIGLVVDKQETRHPINSPNDIYSFADDMLNIISAYESK